METAHYAWKITRDLWAEAWPEDGTTVGTVGPRNAPDDLLSRVDKGHTFYLYDDDENQYATGRAVWHEGHAPSVDDLTAVGPLRDFGGPQWGGCLIRWHGRPEWTCEA